MRLKNKFYILTNGGSIKVGVGEGAILYCLQMQHAVLAVCSSDSQQSPAIPQPSFSSYQSHPSPYASVQPGISSHNVIDGELVGLLVGAIGAFVGIVVGELLNATDGAKVGDSL